MFWSQELTIQLQKSIKELTNTFSQFSKTPEQGVTRLVYSDEWLSAQLFLKQKCEELNFHTYFDEAGNLFSSFSGAENSIILTGSHIDTVENGGKYDGTFGVIAGFIALSFLKKQFGKPKKTIELVSFCEEEGSRYPLTFWGSKLITKEIVDFPLLATDKEGITLSEAMNKAGFPPEKLKTMKKKENIDAFIELHIEQGARLERGRKSIGIVEQIAGIFRFTITLDGEANHSGTTPMSLRKDALFLSSQLFNWLVKAADYYGDPLVATVGQLFVEPNIPNVIPGKVTFTIDLRHPQTEVLKKFRNEMESYFKSFAKQHEVNITIEQWLETSPVEMNSALTKMSQHICEKNKIDYQLMTSGAGHDSQIMAKHYPTALLFVPSKKGISHSPEEYTSPEELAIGVKLLIELLYTLAY